MVHASGLGGDLHVHARHARRGECGGPGEANVTPAGLPLPVRRVGLLLWYIACCLALDSPPPDEHGCCARFQSAA
eukprot:6197240-Pleurochrysis_carterae.AAC.1